MNPRLDRRSFLETSLGASTALAAGLFVAGPAKAAAQAKDQQVRVAVMGLSRGLSLAQTFAKQPGVTIAALSEADEGRLAAGASTISKLTGSEPRTEADVRRLLDDDSIDLLVCAAPNHWHGPATIMACAAGKHVYVEKPCCHNPAEGEMMIAAARKHGRCVQVGTQRRSNVAIGEGIQLLRDGAIGEPYYARAWYANQRGPIPAGEPTDPPKGLDYDLWQGPAPRKPFRSNYLHYNWHWFWHWGNGELGNNGVHAIDLARWALDVDYPELVTSAGGRYAYDDEQETPDTHVVNFVFPGGKQLMWEGLSCNRWGLNGTGFGITVHGNAGTLEIGSDGYVLHDARGKEVKKNSGGGPGDELHAANLLAAIRANDPKMLNCEVEIGHKSTLAPHLGNIAQRVGRVLKCDPKNGHVVGDEEAMTLWGREYEKGWEPVV